MDDEQATPLLFANKVIHKFVDNLLGTGIDSSQTEAIRVVFRQCGGEWSRILAGDPVHIGLLIRLIQVWGKSKLRNKPPDQNSQEVFARA